MVASAEALREGAGEGADVSIRAQSQNLAFLQSACVATHVGVTHGASRGFLSALAFLGALDMRRTTPGCESSLFLVFLKTRTCTYTHSTVQVSSRWAGLYNATSGCQSHLCAQRSFLGICWTLSLFHCISAREQKETKRESGLNYCCTRGKGNK